MSIRMRAARRGADRRAAAWKLGYLEAAQREGREFLTPEQYAHVVQQFESLATEDDPRFSKTQDVRSIEDFFELRDKGGILGKLNVRVYFAIFGDRRLILALACYKKEREGQTPTHIRVRVRNRLRYARRLLQS